MGYRIHTTFAANVAIQFGTVEQIDEELGYCYDWFEAGDYRLVLNDINDREAWVLAGSEDEWRRFAERLMAQLDARKLDSLPAT